MLRADRERAVPQLPTKLIQPSTVLFHPLRGVAFEVPNQIGQGTRFRQSTESMHMVLDTADLQGGTPESLKGSRHVGIQFLAKLRVAKKGSTVFGREDNVQVNLGQRLRNDCEPRMTGVVEYRVSRLSDPSQTSHDVVLLESQESCPYPEGVSQQSPGSRPQVAHPGITTVKAMNPEGVLHPSSTAKMDNPFRVDSDAVARPRVRSLRDRPWAVMDNPFGVQRGTGV